MKEILGIKYLIVWKKKNLILIYYKKYYRFKFIKIILERVAIIENIIKTIKNLILLNKKSLRIWLIHLTLLETLEIH